MDERTARIDVVTRVIQSAKEISVIIGIFVALFGIYTTLQNERRNAAQARMAGLGALDKFMADDSAIRSEVGKFLRDYGGSAGKQELTDLISRYGSGERAYESEELTSMRTIGRHYERMGLYVRLEYLDFPLVYEVVSFPDEFWAQTADFRERVQKDNWSASGSALPDFWKNFAYLEQRFQEQRAVDRNK